MLFSFDGLPVRTLKIKGEPWFSAADVCAALQMGNPRQAIKTHVDADDVQFLDAIDSLGRAQPTNFINESGLYALIFGSTKDAARRFKRWVTGDVSALVRLVDDVPPPDTAKPGEPDSPRRTRTSQPRQPVLFSFDGLPVRTLKIKGEPWFVTADVCAALEIANNRDAIARLADDEVGVGTTDTNRGARRVGIVNESGLYNLIFSSRRPEAQRFRRWVTGEVLPSIRKTGAYRIDHETRRARDVLNLATGHARALGLKGAPRLETARAVVLQLAPDLAHLVPTAPPPAPTRAELRAEAERQKAEAQRADRVAALDAVRQWLATHAETRLMWWHLFASLPKSERDKAAGLRRLVGPDGHPIAPGDDGPHRVECLIFPEVFRREVCRGFDPKFVGEVLRDAGWLKHDRDRFTMKHRLPGIGNAPVFHLRPGAIEAPN